MRIHREALEPTAVEDELLPRGPLVHSSFSRDGLMTFLTVVATDQ